MKSDFLDTVCIESRDLCIANTKTQYIDIYYMLQRHILYVAKTYIICCTDTIYMLQRQNVYVAKTTSICYKDKIYML